MPIEFSQFPANWREPLYWVEVDPSQAGTAQIQLPALLMGQMSSEATMQTNVPIACGDPQNAAALAGQGSMLARMFEKFFENNTAQEMFIMGIPDPVGAAATGSITVATAPTQAGTLALYIAGQLIQVGIGASDTTNIVASNIVTAINETPSLPVTAALDSTSGHVVNLTCKWKGTTGNDISVMDTYAGTLGAQALPQGLTLTYTGTGAGYTGGFLTGGTGTPTLTTAISAMGDDLYEYVAFPWTDSTSLLAIQTEYAFSSTGRWGWMRQLFGQIYSAYRGTYATILGFGQSQNAPQTTVMDMEPALPSPVWEVAAAYCAQAAIALSNDPARPLQTLPLLGILPPLKQYRFTLTELNILASNGIATQKTIAGVVTIMRETTTYQLNTFGTPDGAYTDITTLATLAKLLRNQKAAITTKFPRYKLADDGTLFGPGQAIVTPKIIKAELVAEYANDEFNGLVENSRAFARNLIVERDSVNPNRVNVLYPPNLVAQLRIFAVLAQFRLLGAEQTTRPLA
jgi:phage tail sheath gpL-like